MANLANLLATIAANVYTNHNNEVTAQMVKDAMGAIVSTMGQGGYIYKGKAVLSPTPTNPNSTDANVFYIATEPGTYNNFKDGGGNSIVVNAGEVAILRGTGTSWSKDVTGAATAAQLSALGQEVDDNTFHRLVDGDAIVIENGGVNSDGSNVGGNAYIRTKDAFSTSLVNRVALPDGFKVQFVAYYSAWTDSSTFTFVRRDYVGNRVLNLDTSQNYARLSIQKQDGTNVTTADLLEAMKVVSMKFLDFGAVKDGTDKTYDRYSNLFVGTLISSGASNTDANYKHTDYIDVRNSKLVSTNGAFYRVCYYSDNAGTLQKYAESTTLNQQYLEAASYIRIAFANNQNSYYGFYVVVKKDIDAMDARIARLSNEVGASYGSAKLTAGTALASGALRIPCSMTAGQKFYLLFSTTATLGARPAVSTSAGFITGIYANTLTEFTANGNITYVELTLQAEYVTSSGEINLTLYAPDSVVADRVLTRKNTAELLDNIFFNAPQINDGLKSTCASAAQVAYDKETAHIGVVTHGGWLVYGEGYARVDLDIFQLSNPTNVKHITIAENGESVGPVGTATTLSEVNVVYAGNRTWRVFFIVANKWCYRDYHFDTDTLDDAVVVQWNFGGLQDVIYSGSAFVEEYLEDAGYTGFASYMTILTSSLYRNSSGRIFGAASGEGGMYPILYYSDDNMATLVPFAVYPAACYYEASCCYLGSRLYCVGRGQSSDSNTWGYSDDDGANWTITSRGGDSNRPRIYNYNDTHIIVFQGTANRKSFDILKGTNIGNLASIFSATAPWGFCYASLLMVNGYLYAAYSDGQTNLVENFDPDNPKGNNAPYKDACKFAKICKI